MARMYHPGTGAEITVPDDEGHQAVLADSGWKLAPEPEALPGHEPEPVVYAPVDKPRGKTAKQPDKASAGD